MPELEINYWAVLVAGVGAFILGMLWYMPMLFGNIWMRSAGMTREQLEAGKKDMAKPIFIALVSALLAAYVLAYTLQLIGAETMSEAATGAFWLWLGFVATSTIHSVLWEKKSWTNYFIFNSFQLLSLIGMAIIFVSWM